MYIHRYTTHTRAIHCTRIGLSSAFLDFMVSKETKIAKISEALEGATVKQLDEIIGILAPQGDRRRFLQPTLSEAKDDESARAERLDLCHTQKRRRMEQLAEGTYYVAPTKTSVRFAVTWWTEQSSLYHPPLFLLTALIRLVFVDVKGLRQYSVTKHWCLNINGRPFYKSVILRNLYEAPTCQRAIDITRFQALTRTMAMMHCHNLLAKNDGFHTVCRRALRQIKGFSANHQPGALEIEARQE